MERVCQPEHMGHELNVRYFIRNLAFRGYCLILPAPQIPQKTNGIHPACPASHTPHSNTTQLLSIPGAGQANNPNPDAFGTSGYSVVECDNYRKKIFNPHNQHCRIDRAMYPSIIYR